jgi:hypothetical protein
MGREMADDGGRESVCEVKKFLCPLRASKFSFSTTKDGNT